MTRLHLEFGCGSLKLAGTLDSAPGLTGLLIVSGGNEIRSGTFAGQSKLAARIAKMGFPVFRFDRRGIGDSEGENRGFRKSKKDIRSALEAFRALSPQMERVIGFGNCDAATALMLSSGEGLDGLVLSNPWAVEASAEVEGMPSSGAIRARYSEKLKNPREWGRLLSGGVDLRKLAKGIVKSAQPMPEAPTLIDEMRIGLSGFEGNASILLAGADRTAQEFERYWQSNDDRIARCEGASHAYVDPDHMEWLEQQILAALRA